MSTLGVGSRVSDNLLRTQLLSRIEANQTSLSTIEEQISTGQRISLPSQDPNAAMRAISVQSLLQQTTQVGTNLSINQSYLNATDSALSSVGTQLTNMQSVALASIGTTATDAQRSQAADQVDQTIQQLVQLGNQTFNGRYLFGGSESSSPPFLQTTAGVVYQGNESNLYSYSDINSLFQTNVSGDQAFGATQLVSGSTDLNPALTFATPLSQLNGGQGVAQGSIAISDGFNTSTINLSGAATIGDVATLIEKNPPPGRTLIANVTSTGLTVQFGPDSLANPPDLTINEVASGTTATDLGILQTQGVGSGPVVGADLNPPLELTTPLGNILGSQASASVPGVGGNNGLVFQANQNGTSFNGVTVNFVDSSKLQAGPGITAGHEVATYNANATPATAALQLPGPSNDLILTASQSGTAFNGVAVKVVGSNSIGNGATAAYNAGTKTLTLTVSNNPANQTSVDTLITAINTDGTFTAKRDASAEANTSGGSVLSTTAGTLANTYNTGADAKTLTVDIQSGVTTANDIIAAVNAQGTFTAKLDPTQLNNNGTGFIVDSSTDPAATGTTSGGSGTVFDTTGIQIVNGGKTYSLSFSSDKTIEDVLNTINSSGANVVAELNPQGTGIDVRSVLSGSNFSIGENGGTSAAQLGIRTLNANTPLSELNNGTGVTAVGGTDFTITRKDGVSVPVNLTGAVTIGDVLNAINNNPANTAGGIPVVAQLSQFGNGIELVNNDPSTTSPLSITTTTTSRAAAALGLIPSGSSTSAAPVAGNDATASISLPGSNNSLLLTSTVSGTQPNGVTVNFVDVGAGTQSATYDAVNKTLTFDIQAGVTTGSQVASLLAADPTASAAFTASVQGTDGAVPVAGTAAFAGGSADTLTGTDPNPLQGSGVFTALLQLSTALKANDNLGIQNAANLLQQASSTVSSAEADVGVRLQSVGALQTQLQTQQTNLQGSLSTDIDTDMASAISNLTAQQTAFQATLQLAASVSQLSLLNYLHL
jgi:flagellar hook-associated protein 3 FlgL